MKEKTSWIWKETAEVLGVLGVIASLVFVAMEIRQNTDAVRSTAIQGMLDQSFAANLTPVDNASLRDAIYSTPEELTDDQRRQLGWFYAALIRLQLNRYSQAGIGVVDEATVLDLGARGGVYQTATFRSWWKLQGGRYSDDFEQWFDSIVNGPPVEMSWFNSVEE